MKSQYYDLFLLFHLHLNMKNGVTFIVSLLNVIRFDLEKSRCEEFSVCLHAPEKSTLYNYLSVLLIPLTNSLGLNSTSCFLFATTFTFMSYSFNCISKCLLTLQSQLCVKGIQRLSKSIYSSEFRCRIKYCYRNVLVFLPHQRQTEYRPGSATDLIYYTLSGDMKRDSKLPFLLFGGKLSVSLAHKILTTQSISYYTNTSITSL